MAHRVKNGTKRKIGVNSGAGIFSLKPGESRVFEGVLNLDLLKSQQGIEVSEEKEVDEDADKASKTANKTATATAAPKAG